LHVQRTLQLEHDRGRAGRAIVDRRRDDPAAIIVRPPHPADDAATVVENDAVDCAGVDQRLAGFFDRAFALQDDQLAGADADRVVHVSRARDAELAPGAAHVGLERGRIAGVYLPPDPLAGLAVRIEGEDVPDV